MTLSELRFIVALAHEKNFRRAAEKSFVSQPALSLGVKKIDIIDRDTYNPNNNFFSARRSIHKKENDYGRNISIIMIN